ncbi:MAG: glycerol-3-phosphate acyltransferase [Chloroflexi bacterium]|jgi:glycerol-3-phosphate acyltransferase PlsY|nr:glycerol-3-phosphate acyltransferase [Anaerolineaceae bacterium]NLI44272.1 glycerol-3-phosphate acyltransferase [Chloroflexota bacterium]HOE34692.1 glycerol-3-phosphate acyltransferase [Anaerolineaceae bacterium]HOT25759.1 glycerol-3-phosphate acyltransferase [Anaerolineaceae bacterium]HQH57966.1 glycerol-3-phosphate acyltransferase [Anaerolineaceae bacterium]
MTWILCALAAFLCGSLPFSVWLSRLFYRLDPRDYGDGNPGAFNTFHTGKAWLGLLVLFLDISKAILPVWYAYRYLVLRGVPMALIAIMPMLGHAFSPFLRFRGGKALAAALGVWIGLTGWTVSGAAVLGTLLAKTFFANSGWSGLAGLALALPAIFIFRADRILLLVWLLQLALLAWTLRKDLTRAPQFRPWLKRLFASHKP